MKTELDPIFEQKDNREFGKTFAIEVTVILITAYIMVILCIILFFRWIVESLSARQAIERLDAVHPIFQIALCCSPGIAYLIYRTAKKFNEYLEDRNYDLKHNDQR